MMQDRYEVYINLRICHSFVAETLLIFVIQTV